MLSNKVKILTKLGDQIIQQNFQKIKENLKKIRRNQIPLKKVNTLN